MERPFTRPWPPRSHTRSITRWQPCVCFFDVKNATLEREKPGRSGSLSFLGFPFNLICRPDAPFPSHHVPQHLHSISADLKPLKGMLTNVQRFQNLRSCMMASRTGMSLASSSHISCRHLKVIANLFCADQCIL